jgi:hypothetical protein
MKKEIDSLSQLHQPIVLNLNLLSNSSYHIGVINAPSDYIKSWLNETILANYNNQLSEQGLDLCWSFVVSIFLVGGAIGSLSGSVFKLA